MASGWWNVINGVEVAVPMFFRRSFLYCDGIFYHENFRELKSLGQLSTLLFSMDMHDFDRMDECEELVDPVVDGRQHRGDMLNVRVQNLQLREQIKALSKRIEQNRSTGCSKVFHLFTRLPPELRRKIWHHALPGPRVVNFDFVHHSPYTTPCFETNHGTPALLHVCHESREVALESYELVFQSRFSSRPAIYFNLKRDTLCFTGETTPVRIVLFLEDMPREDVHRVRYLAVGTELPKEVVKYITQFHGIEVFSLILMDPRAATPVGRFGLVEVDHQSIWVMGAYWNHGLTSWGAMEMSVQSAFEDEKEMHPDCNVPAVEFVYMVSTEEGCCKDCPGHGNRLKEESQ